jgi:putative two-component system response regulator
MTHRKTVLVADDHAPTREAYASFLLDCGYEVLEAGSGGEAILHMYRDRRPDVVLMDILMPGLDGVETAQSLRERLPEPRMPLIAVTGSRSAVEQHRLRGLFDAVLLKPCAPDVIASCVDSLVDAA